MTISVNICQKMLTTSFANFSFVFFRLIDNGIRFERLIFIEFVYFVDV